MGIKYFINKILSRLGYNIVSEINNPGNKNFGYGLGYEASLVANPYIEVVRDYTMVPYINLLILFEQVLHFEKNLIEGDFVECGVWKGGAIGLMALANLNYGKFRRDIHLFDVFDDICAPDGILDGSKALHDTLLFAGQNAKFSGELTSLKGFYNFTGGAGSLDGNKKLFEEIIHYPKDRVHYHRGWFQDTIPLISKSIKKIAILRLDGDWYASTKVCIDYLYDKVIKGGIIIIDDYGCYEGCKKAIDEFLARNNIVVFLNYSNTTCRYWIKN